MLKIYIRLLDIRAKLQRGSILWRAVLHSVLLSALTIVLLSAISYMFMLTLIQRGSVDVDIYELVRDAAQLGQTLVLVGVVSFLLSIVLSFSFGRRLTEPFMEMRRKVEKIRPGHWGYRQTIHTGDEAEQLDLAFASLTRRLTKIYAHLEDEIDARTHELEQEYEKDRTILQSIQAGILVIDQKGMVQQANQAALQLLHVSEKDVLGAPCFDVLQLQKHKKPVPKAEHPVYMCLHSHKQVQASPDVHMSAELKSGTSLPIKLAVSPLMRGRKSTGAIVLFYDVTMERHVDYMKTDFLTLASHHLRTPLSTLQWYLELLAEDEGKNLSADQKSFLAEMRMASKKMSSVLGELMDASRLSEGGVVPVFRSADVCSLVSDIVRDSKSLFDSHGVECVLNFTEKECALVQTDPLLANIILQNFLQNAAKYSKKGGKVAVSLVRSGKNISVKVADEGIGIPYSEQQHIFEKLYRATNARSFEANGAGLGLYSCKMIAEKIKAGINFTSEEEKGSVFTVTFPIANTKKKGAAKKSAAKKRSKNTSKK